MWQEAWKRQDNLRSHSQSLIISSWQEEEEQARAAAFLSSPVQYHSNMVHDNRPDQVEGIPLADFTHGGRRKIQWQGSSVREMYAHMARHQLGYKDLRWLYLGELLVPLGCNFEGEFARLVVPKVVSALESRWRQLLKRGIITVQHDRAIWPAWTRGWAQPDWNGDITPPSQEVKQRWEAIVARETAAAAAAAFLEADARATDATAGAGAAYQAYHQQQIAGCNKNKDSDDDHDHDHGHDHDHDHQHHQHQRQHHIQHPHQHGHPDGWWLYSQHQYQGHQAQDEPAEGRGGTTGTTGTTLVEKDQPRAPYPQTKNPGDETGHITAASPVMVTCGKEEDVQRGGAEVDDADGKDKGRVWAWLDVLDGSVSTSSTQHPSRARLIAQESQKSQQQQQQQPVVPMIVKPPPPPPPLPPLLPPPPLSASPSSNITNAQALARINSVMDKVLVLSHRIAATGVRAVSTAHIEKARSIELEARRIEDELLLTLTLSHDGERKAEEGRRLVDMLRLARTVLLGPQITASLAGIV